MSGIPGTCPIKLNFFETLSRNGFIFLKRLFGCRLKCLDPDGCCLRLYSHLPLLHLIALDLSAWSWLVEVCLLPIIDLLSKMERDAWHGIDVKQTNRWIQIFCSYPIPAALVCWVRLAKYAKETNTIRTVSLQWKRCSSPHLDRRLSWLYWQKAKLRYIINSNGKTSGFVDFHF